jgi:hypothetical protein
MFSGRFRQYAQELSDHLIATYKLQHKYIVEVGGGQGEFLKMICERGNNVGLNIDPNCRPADDISRNVRFVREFFRVKDAHKPPPDFVICRHLLEHLANPREFIKMVRKMVDQNAIVYFEVPNANFILRKSVCWEIIHQHCSYFTSTSLSKLFSECGFELCDISERFGGQFLALEARVRSQAIQPRQNGWTDRQETTKFCNAMGTAFNSSVKEWSHYLEEQRKKRRRLIAWGAGAKAVTFLNVVDPDGTAVSHVVDVNPRKVSRFIPGSAQEIISPNAVRDLRPEIAVITNPIYREEIGAALSDLGLIVKLMVA